MIIRNQVDDAEFLTWLAIESKRYWGYPDSWIQEWRPILTIRPESIVSYETFSKLVGKEVVGFYQLNAIEEPAQLKHLWVLPNKIGTGIGRELFTHAVDRAVVLDRHYIHIHADPNARGFYEKMTAELIGFAPSVVQEIAREVPIMEFRCPEVYPQINTD